MEEDSVCYLVCFGLFRPRERPTLVTALSGRRVVCIAAGSNHSAAVTEEGTVYTWGKGSYGRLGHGQ